MNIGAVNNSGYGFSISNPASVSRMQSPGTNAILENIHIIEPENVSKTHPTNIVEKPAETQKIYRTETIKSLYSEPVKKFSGKYFISYFGINYSKR